MEHNYQKGSKNYVQTENITQKHAETSKEAHRVQDSSLHNQDQQQNARLSALEGSASNQLRIRYSSEQNLPIILEDRSGEKSGTERLSASAKLAKDRESASQTFHSNHSPAKRLNMSMFFDELTSRLLASLKGTIENLNRSQALQKFKSFATNKQETAHNLLYPEMSAIELYISDIFNVKLNEDEPLILDAYLGNPIQLFSVGPEASRHIPIGAPSEVVNVTQRSGELKANIVHQVQKMQTLKFRHMMSAFETHIESRSVESLEKVLNPKRLGSKPHLAVFTRASDEQMYGGLSSPSESQQGRPKSKLQLITQMVESFEARTSEDTDILNNLDSKLAEITDRIDRL